MAEGGTFVVSKPIDSSLVLHQVYSGLKKWGTINMFNLTQIVCICQFDEEEGNLETEEEIIQFEVEPSTDERKEEDQTQVHEESGRKETTAPHYQLARDRDMRVNTPPKRYSYADLICYALNAAEKV
ncbi:hypothetical protein A2U01_0000144 [Trifolium medium]|uniref:Uncharacterized protein n=1 Tax=Trifolium medium TaxID=97028 RepID=A0A392LWY9_9FABA|nr:hypothetical protein [Trifolium medium]